MNKAIQSITRRSSFSVKEVENGENAGQQTASLSIQNPTPTHCVLFMLCCMPESKSEKAEEEQPSLDAGPLSVCEGRDSRVSERVGKGEGEGEAAHSAQNWIAAALVWA